MNKFKFMYVYDTSKPQICQPYQTVTQKLPLDQMNHNKGHFIYLIVEAILLVMGILRLLFAFSVITYHAREPHGLLLFNQTAAILSFFIISGFYMALILDGKYQSKISFYISRGLRIFPLYWVALSITLILGFIKIHLHLGSEETAITHYFQYSTHLSGIPAIVEFVNFILRNFALILTRDYFYIQDNLAPGYLIVNPAWTLQIELIFYVLAPFLMRIKKNFLLFVLFYVTIFYGIIEPFSLVSEHNLIYSFLKYALFFLFGMISYRYVYKHYKKPKMTKLPIVVFIFFLIFIIFYQFLPGKILDKSFMMGLVYYAAFSLSIPYFFTLTKGNRFDRFIGELSYPVYITHMIFAKVLFSLHIPQIPFLNSFLIAIPTILFSIFLVKIIQDPIDKFRHKIISIRR